MVKNYNIISVFLFILYTLVQDIEKMLFSTVFHCLAPSAVSEEAVATTTNRP